LAPSQRSAATTTPAATYYFQVDGYNGASGTLKLNLKLDNDDIAQATEIATLPYGRAQNTTGASTETGEPTASCMATPAENSVWYSFSPSFAQDVVAETFGSDYDTELAVWVGSPVSEVGCNDDAGFTLQSEVAFRALAGATYYFQIDGYAGASGNLDFDLKPADLDGDGVPDDSDNCPVDANADQWNTDGDALGDVCDPDVDGDGLENGVDNDDDGNGVLNVDEAACGSEPQHGGRRPERVDGAFAGVDDDGDTDVDEALPAGSEAFDCDGDGFIGSAEAHVFGGLTGRDQDPCGMDAWAADFVTGGVPDSTNRITINDMASFVAPVMRVFTSPGDAGFNVRWDIIPGPGAVSQHININDLAALVAGSTSTPPMLGGAKAFNGPACPWPP
jgi:hypothetical protein